MDFWKLRCNRLNGGKDFSSGRVELQIRDRFDLTDFAEVAYQTKEVIAHQFGEQTLKLHYALAAIAFQKPEAWKQKITVSASKLLADFGEDKKRNYYIPKNEIRNIGYGQEIEIAKTDRNTALNLKRSFDRGLKTLAKFEHPYSFVYEADIPQWVNPDSKIKKPKQWFNSWLKCSGILLQPEFEPQKKLPTPKNSSQQSKTEIKKNHDSLVLGQRIKNARKSSGISLRTAALLSLGYAAIALPGIFNGYRQPKDELGRKTGLAKLIPQLQVFATPGRTIYFAFDKDTKASTIANVNNAIAKTGKLFTKAGVDVKVIRS